MADLQQIIEQAFENRAEITPANVDAEVKGAVLEAIELLDSGAQRVAEPADGGWQVNEWLKKAVLLSFRIRENEIMAGGFTQYYDKVDSKFDGMSSEQHAASGVRVVPPAVARKGAFVAPGVVMMPSYVNIGAYVDSGTMVDTWAKSSKASSSRRTRSFRWGYTSAKAPRFTTAKAAR
jgi:2,3,4,5-tetrahydropyridine-2-carboxylate N-succinyltransferase